MNASRSLEPISDQHKRQIYADVIFIQKSREDNNIGILERIHMLIKYRKGLRCFLDEYVERGHPRYKDLCIEYGRVDNEIRWLT